MKIEIDNRYIIESSTHDFVLYEKKVSQSGKTKGQIVLSRLGFFPKMHQLVCSGQLKLATDLEFFQYRFSDSFGGNPPL